MPPTAEAEIVLIIDSGEEEADNDEENRKRKISKINKRAKRQGYAGKVGLVMAEGGDFLSRNDHTRGSKPGS